LALFFQLPSAVLGDPPLSFPPKGLLQNVRLPRCCAPRNDRRCISVSLRAIRRIARQSQLSLTEFGNRPQSGNPALPGMAHQSPNWLCFFKRQCTIYAIRDTKYQIGFVFSLVPFDFSLLPLPRERLASFFQIWPQPPARLAGNLIT
jgi:hypothetical protein